MWENSKTYRTVGRELQGWGFLVYIEAYLCDGTAQVMSTPEFN